MFFHHFLFFVAFGYLSLLVLTLVFLSANIALDILIIAVLGTENCDLGLLLSSKVSRFQSYLKVIF